jgi:NAD-specific glutamate dehydrogenase
MYILSSEEVLQLEKELDSINIAIDEAIKIDLDSQIKPIWSSLPHIGLLDDDEKIIDYNSYKADCISKSAKLQELSIKKDNLRNLGIRKRQIRERLDNGFVRNKQFNSLVEALELLVNNKINLSKLAEVYGKVTGEKYGSLSIDKGFIDKKHAEEIILGLKGRF